MVLDLQKVAGRTSGSTCQPTLGRIEAATPHTATNGWLGIAQIWTTSRSHITQAVTKVNDSYFNTANYNKPEWRRLVMCQEIAHDFGLDHQDENFDNPNLGTCMDYTSKPLGPPSNEHPNAHDYGSWKRSTRTSIRRQRLELRRHKRRASISTIHPSGDAWFAATPPAASRYSSTTSRAAETRHSRDLGGPRARQVTPVAHNGSAATRLRCRIQRSRDEPRGTAGGSDGRGRLPTAPPGLFPDRRLRRCA